MTAETKPGPIAAADWSMRLGTPGAVAEGVEDIEQCIRIVLGTPRGSVPHRPELGCDLWRYLDLPADRARPLMVQEATDAVTRWEPRAEVVGVAAGADPDDPTALLLEVTYRPRAAAVAAGRTLAVRVER